MENKWNKLAQYFFRSNVSSADNVEIIEPILVKELKKIEKLKIIDFGCGSGSFCKRISEFADHVLGIDSSIEMIKIAKSNNSTKNIDYTNESLYKIDIQKFNTFNAEFVMQFFSDDELKDLLAYISNSDVQKILIANDRLEFIDQSISNGKTKFKKKNSEYAISLADEKIKIFPRTIETLKRLLDEINFELENCYELKYPETFLKKFPEMFDFPVDLAAYTVLIFRRK